MGDPKRLFIGGQPPKDPDQLRIWLQQRLAVVDDFTSTFSRGVGTPEGVVQAPKGCVYQRLDGGAGTCFYVKESGTGKTGWVAK